MNEEELDYRVEYEKLEKKYEEQQDRLDKAIEYIEKNAITNIRWIGTKATTKELFKDNASLYELLQILEGSNKE